MAQAFHGGQVAAAAREFGLAQESILDFSSNLNVLAPTVSEAEWEQWAAEIIHYPEPDAETLTNRLAEIYRLESEFILPTAGSIEGLYLAARLFAGCRVGDHGARFQRLRQIFRILGLPTRARSFASGALECAGGRMEAFASSIRRGCPWQPQ